MVWTIGTRDASYSTNWKSSPFFFPWDISRMVLNGSINIDAPLYMVSKTFMIIT